MQTIKVILAESGRVANLKKDFPLYVGSYQNKLLNVLVPKSILAPNFTSHYIDTDGVVKSVDGAYTAVKIGMTYLERTGVIKQSTTFFMRYLKDVVINNVEYSMYERLLPKEFTLFEGQGENAPKLIVNIVNVLVETKIDDENIESIGTTLEVITSQYASIDVMYSADLNNEPEYNPSDMELLSAIVNSHIIDVETSLKNSSDALETSINADNKAAEALLKAEDALNTVVSEKGTSVYVNNQAQLRLDFETDPQNQINNVKKDVATLQTNKADNTTVEALQTQANENATNITELQTNKADKTMLSTPNLLINGDFRINQRGKKSYSGANVYSDDRWLLTGATSSFNDETKQFKTSTQYGSFRQIIENYTDYAGKTVTLSCKISTFNSVGNDLYLAIVDGSQTEQVKVSSSGITTVTATISTSPTRLICMLYKTGTTGNLVEATIEYMKLEIGLISTAFSPRPYAEELALCQRYYVKIKPTVKYGTFAIGGITGIQADSTNKAVTFNIYLPVEMRTNPTLLKNGTLMVMCSGIYKSPLSIRQDIGSINNAKTIICYVESSIGDVGRMATLRSNDSDAEINSLEFDAEIY